METHDKQVMTQINSLVQLVDGFIPLYDELSSDPAQRYALSRMYADKEFRDYLVRILKASKNALGEVSDLQGLWLCKGRIEVLAELLGTAKKMFEDTVKLDKIK